jgi:hypothetical protein
LSRCSICEGVGDGGGHGDGGDDGDGDGDGDGDSDGDGNGDGDGDFDVWIGRSSLVIYEINNTFYNNEYFSNVFK